MLNKPNQINLFFQKGELKGEPVLPSSKSESNRALLLYTYSKGAAQLVNISESDDTKTLKALLESKSPELNAGHAGSTFRFLTTYLALHGIGKTLTGSEQLKKRPIGVLVEALRQLGAEIDYLGEPGFPPLYFRRFHSTGISSLEIDPTISSQFITSLMMAAPTLPNGLHLKFSNSDVSSFSYLEMTWKMMQKMGIQGSFSQTEIQIPEQNFIQTVFEIESDWSSASYWLAMACLTKSKLTLRGLYQNSLQGDSRILEILKPFGLQYSFYESKLRIESSEIEKVNEPLVLNLNSFPDLAQTLIVLCVIKGIPFQFSGLKSLAIKETNRLEAMKSELAKLGISLQVDPYDGTCKWEKVQKLAPPTSFFETYEDHRMALSLSLFALQFPIKINQPDVVSKSYPGYWEELQKLGFSVVKN